MGQLPLQQPEPKKHQLATCELECQSSLNELSNNETGDWTMIDQSLEMLPYQFEEGWDHHFRSKNC